MRVWKKPIRCPFCGGKLYNVVTLRLKEGRKVYRTDVFAFKCIYCDRGGIIIPAGEEEHENRT